MTWQLLEHGISELPVFIRHRHLLEVLRYTAPFSTIAKLHAVIESYRQCRGACFLWTIQ